MTPALKPTVEAQAGHGEKTETPALHRLVEGVAQSNDTFALLNRYTGSRYAHLGQRAGQWFETTAEVYWYFLEQMPPMHMTGEGFIVCEAVTGTLHNAFFEFDGRYFCALIDCREQGAFDATCRALKANVRT